MNIEKNCKKKSSELIGLCEAPRGTRSTFRSVQTKTESGAGEISHDILSKYKNTDTNTNKTLRK